MKQALLILSVLGIGIAQMSGATETTFQPNDTLSHSRSTVPTAQSGSSGKLYSTSSGAYVYSNDEISQAIDDLVVVAEQKKIKRQREQDELAKKPNVRIGMTTSQVLHKSNWGYPADINTTINTYGKLEQWVYGGNKYLYFMNDKLTSIQY